MAKSIKARVVCAQYGSHFHGEVIEVEEREIERVSPRNDKGERVYETLIPVEIEEERRKAAATVTLAESDPGAQNRKDAEVAWRKLAQKSDAIMAARRVEEARKLVQTASTPKA